MEANEAQELQEQAEHGSHESSLRPVAFTMSVVTISDKDAAQKLAKSYKDHQAKWADELKEDQEKAEALQEKVEQAEVRANRFDLSEALLEIGLVITSVTLLTHSRIYWYLGLVFSILGIASAASVLLLH